MAKIIWGTQQKSVSRPPGLTGALPRSSGPPSRYYNLFILLLGPAIALGFWFVLQRTRAGRFIRAAALDRETLGALGVNVDALYTGVFVLASFLGGLGGALITPMRAIVPGMDTEVIVEAFVVVVIGGLGSFWGTFLGRAHLRPGALLRHPLLPALLHLLGLRPHGRRAHHPPLGPPRAGPLK